MIGALDLSSVNWLFVGLMTALAFITAILGSLIAFRNRFAGAIIAAILFGIGFIAWNYYPHSFGLPILKGVVMDGSGPGTGSGPGGGPGPGTGSGPGSGSGSGH
jgi:hypothetical protein